MCDKNKISIITGATNRTIFFARESRSNLISNSTGTYFKYNAVVNGEMKTVIPIKNVLGFSCYSKVIALSDSINMGGDFDVEKLAIMSTMCGQPSQNNNQMNQLLPLMLFKDKLDGDDDMMKMMLMSSMMGGNMAGNNNPVISYLILDMFMGKKKDEKAQQPAQTPPPQNPAE